ncbi:MAG: hypothetical protein ACJASQ_000259 [Crocinitomicaceae bacterium]|jgi:hypothetical protein
MKYFLLFLTVLAANALSAQTVYESPYVKNGNSFKVSVPSDFFKVGGGPAVGYDIFSKDKTKTLEDFGNGPESDMYMFGIIDREGVESPLAFFNNEIRADGATTIVKEPAKMETKGGDFTHAVVTVGDGDFSVKNMQVGLVIFEDKMVMVMYTPPVNESDVVSSSKFKKVLNSFTVYETTRKNELDVFDPDEVDFDFFENSEFETSLAYEDVFFDTELEGINAPWQEIEDEDMKKLLLSYSYERKENGKSVHEGIVKVFSAGDLEMYTDDASKGEAVYKVFPQHMIRRLSASETFENEALTFTKYNFMPATKGPTKVQDLYSTTFKGELIFILAEKTYDASDQFGAACKELLMTMWFWDEEEYGEDSEEE